MIGGWRDLERPRGGHDNTRQNKTSNGPHHLVYTHSMVRSHGIRSSQFPFDRSELCDVRDADAGVHVRAGRHTLTSTNLVEVEPWNRGWRPV